MQAAVYCQNGCPEVSSIPGVFGTAHECLFPVGNLTWGQTVLIQAGPGALGLAMIQMAKRAGAIVFATSSDDATLARLLHRKGIPNASFKGDGA